MKHMLHLNGGLQEKNLWKNAPKSKKKKLYSLAKRVKIHKISGVAHFFTLHLVRKVDPNMAASVSH